MKIRVRTESAGGRLQMSAMIDVVFLLLVFFIVTFRIVAPEGDLSIQPTAQAAAAVPELAKLPLHVYLESQEDGSLKKLQLDSRVLPDIASLQAEVRRFVETDHEGGRNLEAVVHCDRRLKYDYVIEAITALRGYRDAHGRVVYLVSHIRFDTRAAGN